MQPHRLGYKPPQPDGRLAADPVPEVDRDLLETPWLHEERHGDVGQVEIGRHPRRRLRRQLRVVEPEGDVRVVQPGPPAYLEGGAQDAADDAPGPAVVPAGPPPVDRRGVAP